MSGKGGYCGDIMTFTSSCGGQAVNKIQLCGH